MSKVTKALLAVLVLPFGVVVHAATADRPATERVVAMIGIVEEPVTAARAHDGVKRIPGGQRIDNRLVSGHQMGWD